ncbi:MAG: 23S rRNA (adenine(2503)-C(2))-methyltransferase RlmN [Bacteroidetes bacterium]|nr:MAG: 23S rRNA (adenine(2503)-C(2))-methyltransferase RlmN [Bacteroidota bacterium]
MEKEPLFGKTLQELMTVARTLGMKPFVGKQMADWLYKKRVTSIAGMRNLSKASKEKLEAQYEVGRAPHTEVQESVDGTRKYLFPTAQKRFVEAAYIPDRERATLCVSSQAGCRWACRFCMTGRQGFSQHLSAGDILNQIFSLPEYETLTNLVYMGMGEPFDNLDNVLKSLEILTATYGSGMSPRRITVSSIGIIPAMNRFLQESDCHLAISLHTPFDHERATLMPVQKHYPISAVVENLRSFDFGRQRRISFEYIMFEGFNDTQEHLKEMAKLLHGLRCRVNLIKFHPIPDAPYQGCTKEKMEWFRDQLTQRGLTTTIRASRGEDIYAACGLLSTERPPSNS